MKRCILLTALAVAPCLSAQAGAQDAVAQGLQGDMIWLEPISYTQMREMRERMTKMRAERPKAERPKEKEADNNKRRSKDGAARQWPRMIYLGEGAFPPRKKSAGTGRPAQAAHMHQMPGVAKKSVPETVLWLEMPDSTISRLAPPRRRGAKTVANYVTPAGGSYRMIAHRNGGVSDGRLTRYYSFYAFMSHGDKPDKKETKQQAREGYFKGKPEFEIARYYGDETSRYSNRTGDKVHLRILHRGQPVGGAYISLTTEQNWRQGKYSDQNGEVDFTLIKEDYPEDGVDKRNSELYVVRVEHEVAQSGVSGANPYDSVRYVATMSLRVSPSKLDWESNSTAYLVAMLTIIGAGAAIAVRRRRKRSGSAEVSK